MNLTSLEKSLKVIEALGQNPNGISLSELAVCVGFPKSTIHHILKTFLLHGYVSQEPMSKKYQLGFQFLSIGKIILDNLDIRIIAHPHLQRLQKSCGETVHLAVLRNGKVTYVDKLGHPGGISLATFIGFATDPHAAAGGKVLLAELSEKQIRKIYKDKPLTKYGKNTKTNFTSLLGELEIIRKQGYALDDEEYYEGIRCVAAPVRAGGKIVAAVSVTGSIFSMSRERIEKEIINLVVETARLISSKMSW